MFAFKKFVIHQDRCAMKVGTDGVLLGAWANGGSRILDIGTGTGLIALMMAQRFAKATIDAVEIDAEAATQARENVAATAYADRISIAETAIQLYPTHHKYDAIVSNPPFFIDSLINPNAQRTTARHACALKYCELFAAVKALLDSDGEFSAIYLRSVCKRSLRKLTRQDLRCHANAPCAPPHANNLNAILLRSVTPTADAREKWRKYACKRQTDRDQNGTLI